MRFTNLFGGFATRQNDVASPPSGAPIALAAPEVSGAAGGYVLPPGSLRLWTRDGSTPRCANALWHTAAPGDYLPPTPASGIPAALLGFTNGVRSVTCYAEAVRPSDEQGDIRIVFEVQPDERASVSAASAGVSFVPVIFEIPEPIATATALVKLSYPASDPGAVTTNAAGGYVLPPGSLRLWARDGSTPRCANPVWHASPGDYLPPTPDGGIPAALLGFTNAVRSVTCYAEAVRPSDEQGDIRIVFEVQPDERASVSAADAVRLTAVRFGLVPDYDRDGVIDCHDEAQAATNRIMRWWINDDDNGTDISEGDNDVPGQGHGLTLVSNDTQWPDSATVDGRCDLLDFFPLWLDVGNLLAMLPQDGTTTVCLRQEDGALRAVYTDLRAADAGSYLVSAVANCGPDFAQATHEARTFLIDAADVVLSPAFVNRIVADPRKGVLLVEGCAETQKPLVLEVLRDGVRIMVVELPLSVSGVEDMYRWINLRPDAANYFPSRSNAPPNRPDGECMDKTVFLAHGFLVSKEGARGWASECFKRLYQSGLAAKFCGMSWRADAGTSADYYLNVQNARDTAAQLAPIVNAMPCEKVWMAHSLGNMLSGYAIADHGMNVGKYFALNAAVASEAYDIATVDETESAMNHMRHANWAGYSNRTWASSWFKLFPSGDDRARLTWRNRFTNVLDRTQLYNFWSSGTACASW